ncbi:MULTISPECIES: hypothetical protein [Xenorhabdus]|uniref:Uncharacterized protein n=2 Tax=Xenorhabdus TaxID=626 RepID=A0A2D0IX70_9GAMM|nr:MULTISPECIES: hypothetical protein [Xenorhabdus]PHM26533.1 hypothetical protein Xehl_00874 [Xenorhabdus ehlersii]RKE91778.1 hypothetical protein BDE27_2052 [Xenorhabdus ehlersii]CDG98054.1 Sensory box histidine kinase/response regulator [Xenorhabdus bovienii str. puntauvense]
MSIEERLDRLESAVKIMSMKMANQELEECNAEIEKTTKRLEILKQSRDNHLAVIRSGNYL